VQRYPDAKLRVFVVWLPVRDEDARNRWDPELLHDLRVTHYWDGQLIAGSWFANNLNELDLLVTNPEVAQRANELFAWDAYLLFEPSSRWDDVPSGVLSAGSTVIAKKDRIESAFTSLIREDASG